MSVSWALPLDEASKKAPAQVARRLKLLSHPCLKARHETTLAHLTPDAKGLLKQLPQPALNPPSGEKGQEPPATPPTSGDLLLRRALPPKDPGVGLCA